MENVVGQAAKHGGFVFFELKGQNIFLMVQASSLINFVADRMVVAPSITLKATIMGNDKLTLPKTTATANAQATPMVSSAALPTKAVEPIKATVPPVMPDASVKPKTEAIKNDSDAIKSKPTMQNASVENKADKSAGESSDQGKKGEQGERTKMDIATELYKQMMKNKGMTRKEVLEQFMVQAKLSKAGASTYFQLIKAAQK
jgi:hypothetical protein